MTRPDLNERMSPPVRDSDIMWLAIKRLTAVAEKMQKREYDAELDELMATAAEWFEWAAWNINRRAGKDVPVSDDDVDPFERAALIAETLQNAEGMPANGEQIAQTLRMWKKLPGANEHAAMKDAARELAPNE